MSGSQVDLISVLLLAFSMGLAGLFVFSRWPKWALGVWLVVIAFVPVWLGVNIFFYWLPGVVVGFMAAGVLVRPNRLQLGPADGLVAAFVVACLAPLLVSGGWTLTTIFTVVTQWLLAFAIGRSAPGRIPTDWIYTAIGLTFVVVAGLAVVEFVFAWNPFVKIPGNAQLYSVWGELQVRGSVVRAEGAWGHSIAMGCAIGMSIPVWLATRTPILIRLVGLMILIGGVAVSFSRAAILTAILATLLSLWGLRTEIAGVVRAWVAAVVALIAVVLYPVVAEAYSSGQETAAKSATYRGDLLSLVPDIQILGIAENSYRSPSGATYFRGFQSIDNAVLLLGLTYGWAALILALVLMLGAIVLVVRRRAVPPTLGVVAMIPALFSVALITQLGMYFWFVAGLAIAGQAKANGNRSSASRSARVDVVAVDTVGASR